MRQLLLAVHALYVCDGVVCSVFSVPSGECVFSLRHRYSYGYGYGRCENPFLAAEETVRALRFSQSSQLLLVASQDRSESHAGIVNLFSLGDLEQVPQPQPQPQDSVAAPAPPPPPCVEEEELDGFCCVSVSNPGEEAAPDTSSGGYGEFLRSAAVTAATSLGRSVRAAAAAVMGAQGDCLPPVFHAELPGPLPRRSGSAPPYLYALALIEQRPQAMGQVELLLAAGDGSLHRLGRRLLGCIVCPS